MLIVKRWSVTSTSNFQNVWNWSLNSWFLRIELTVTFDRLTLFHLIDGIWNIPKLKIIGWTEFWGSRTAAVRSSLIMAAPNPGLVWTRRKSRIYVPKWKDHTLSKVFIQPIFMVFKFLQIWNLENDILIFQNFATVWNIRFCFKVRKLTFRKNLPFCWKKFG